MKRFLLSSVAFAALLSASQIAEAQTPSNPPAASERLASEPSEKKSPPPKAQNEMKEAPGLNKPSAGNTSDQKSAPKSASETKEPERTKSSQEKAETPKAASESKGSESPSKTSSEKTGTPKAGSETKEPAKSSTSPPPEKSSPAKASSETKDAPGKSGASQPAPSAPATDKAETKPSTSPTTPSSTPPAANNAAPPAGSASTKTGETKEGQPASQQNAATSAPNAPAVAPEKAAKINEVISREKVQSVDNVNFSVSVGVNVPSTVTVHPLPSSIVEIVPEYRGYDYIVIREEIVIVEPRTRRIITVVHRGGGSASAAQPNTRISLSPDRRRTIKQKLVRSSSPRPAQTSSRLVVGAEVPQTYEIREFPAEVLQESPELRDYEYVLDEDNVVVVDRRERRVIEIID